MITSNPQVRLTCMPPPAQLLVKETMKWAGSLDYYINNAVKFIFGGVRAVSDTGEMPSTLQLSAFQVLKG